MKNPSNAPRLRRQAAQRGASLVVVLLILVVVTILGVGGAQIALLGERSARYDRDYLVASQAAEAALMDAEFDIRGPGGSRTASFNPNNIGLFLADCSTSATTRGMCKPSADTARPVWASGALEDSGPTARSVEYGTFTARTYDAGAGGSRPARAPRYLIEIVDDTEVGNNARYTAGSGLGIPKIYRVTAAGFGPNAQTPVVTQMAFRKESE